MPDKARYDHTTLGTMSSAVVKFLENHAKVSTFIPPNSEIAAKLKFSRAGVVSYALAVAVDEGRIVKFGPGRRQHIRAADGSWELFRPRASTFDAEVEPLRPDQIGDVAGGPEKLAKAVIIQALDDLEMRGHGIIPAEDHADAIAFWFAADGEWAESRKWWCDAAGVDEGKAVKAAKRCLARARKK